MIREERQQRAVRIHTADGAIDGHLQVSPRSRTLDDLNVVSKQFVSLHAPGDLGSRWRSGCGPLAVSKSSILFLRELGTPPVQRGEFGRFTRAPLLLRVGPYDVHGLVHVPWGGAPLKRLDQDGHCFIALTSVLVAQDEAEFTAPFLAVNRSHIRAARQVGEPVGVDDEVPAAVGVAD